MKCALLLLCATAATATKFIAGQAPKCTVDSAGRTIVQYDTAVHASFKCTHTGGSSCSCTLKHPSHHHGGCKQIVARTAYGTMKTHSVHGDCSNNGRNKCERLSPCKNGGTCTNTDTHYTCACPSTHKGTHCETSVCTPSFTNNCWKGKNGQIIKCSGNTYFDDSSKTCKACPQYSKCQNGVVVMRTIRTTQRSYGPTAQQTFKLPQMNVAKCQLSVKARQTDYDSSSEWLQIIHLDGTSQALNTKCGFNQQCHQNLHTCNLSTNVVLVDQGADDEITIQGKHAPSTDYCPYDPTRDGYPNNKSPQSRQGHGACGARGTGPTCYYMWAEVTLDNCY